MKFFFKYVIYGVARKITLELEDTKQMGVRSGKF